MSLQRKFISAHEPESLPKKRLGEYPGRGGSGGGGEGETERLETRETISSGKG